MEDNLDRNVIRYINKEGLFDIIDTAIEAGGIFSVALDGGSASGKTTLADEIRMRHPDDITVFHMDDFFLRPEQRTPERYSEPGGNVDRERFLEEVLKPISTLDEKDNSSKDIKVLYRPLDCRDFTIKEGELIDVKRIRIIEGAYSHHPELRNYYDLRIFLEIDEKHQRERIIKRNTPLKQERFFNEWIPLENKYFDYFDIRVSSDYVIRVV